MAELIKAGAEPEAFAEMTVDLTSDDGLDHYGTDHCKIALISDAQYRRFRKLIPNASNWWWTLTPWSTKDATVSRYVRNVRTDGTLGSNGAYNGAYGVRPLCSLKSSILVSFDPKEAATGAAEETEPHALEGERRATTNMGYSVQQIAVTFGVSRQAVENWLTVQQMPEPLKEAVQSGEISATAAQQLAGLPRGEQVKRFEDMKQQGAKPTAQNVRSAAASPDNKPAPKLKTSKEIKEVLRLHTHDAGEYARGFQAALRWVLGEEGGTANE
jgi:hypothetical protein